MRVHAALCTMYLRLITGRLISGAEKVNAAMYLALPSGRRNGWAVADAMCCDCVDMLCWPSCPRSLGIAGCKLAVHHKVVK
jgi:hypothetical protein